MSSPDVIVVGSGISGLNFALECAENGLRVLVITKKRIVESSTNYAQGGIAAVLEKTDDIQKHIEDTMKAGAYHNRKSAVEYMVKHGREAVVRLAEYGVPFETEEGRLLLTREGGHSERRIAFVGDYTGKAIEEALVHNAKNHPRITIIEHTFAVDLMVRGKTCFGVSVIGSSYFDELRAPSVVLATGGIGQLYAHTTNPAISTGDGFAMAYRAGAKFKDMEFIQFHPTALAADWKQCERMFLLSEALRGEGARLLDYRMKPFMKRYDSRGDLAPRDTVARAVYLEGEKGPVYLDITHEKRETLAARFPQIYRTLKTEYGLDMARKPIPVAPAAHFCCGGIVTDLKGRTNIKNLYAFGEVAWTGAHGANRLASNSLLEAIVFSGRIVKELAQLQSVVGRRKLPSINQHKPIKVAKLSKKDMAAIASIRKSLKKTMWECVGVVRTNSGLQKAIVELKSLAAKMPRGNAIEAIETNNMLQTALLIAQAAKKRQAGIGCHTIIALAARQPHL